MYALAARVGAVHSVAWAEELAEIGEKSIKNIINLGGVNPTKKGGARRLTSEMYDTVTSYGFGGAGGQATARAGWMDSAPPQTVFQEFGTRKNRVSENSHRLTKTRSGLLGDKQKGSGRGGIPAMLAIPSARDDMSNMLRPTGLSTLGRIQSEWNRI